MKILVLLIATCLPLIIAAIDLVSSNVDLILIRGSTISNLNPLKIPLNDTAAFTKSNFDKAKKTVVITYGWQSNFSSPIISAIVGAYLTRRPDFNILVFDWAYYSNQNYLSAAGSIPLIGDYVASNVKILIEKNNIDVANFHFIGHSLGGHLFGYIGRNLQENGKFIIGRITGLDPAGPLFFPDFFFNPLKPLRKTDATFVDVIHTNSRQAGADRPIGHVDFYPNGGRFQPGCQQFSLFNLWSYIQDDCNHGRAWEYYAESVINDGNTRKFRAVKCSTFQLFSQNSCRGAPAFNYMGHYADPLAPGTFFLATNDKPPYSK